MSSQINQAYIYFLINVVVANRKGKFQSEIDFHSIVSYDRVVILSCHTIVLSFYHVKFNKFLILDHIAFYQNVLNYIVTYI